MNKKPILPPGKVGIFCTNCHTAAFSLDRHDFVTCKCSRVFIDGGDDYTRFGGKGIDEGTYEFVTITSGKKCTQ